MDSRLLRRGEKTFGCSGHAHQAPARKGVVGERLDPGDCSMSQPSLAEAMEACARRCREMDAPLSQRLSTFASEVRRLDPVFADVVDRMVNRLQQSHAGAPAPATGEQMPPFVLPDEEGRLVSLVELLKKGPVVASFHRGHWCPYC